MSNNGGRPAERGRTTAQARSGIWLLRTICVPGVLAIMLLAATGYSWLKTSGSGDQTFDGQHPIGGPFTLMNSAGEQVSDRDFRGK